MFVSSIRLVLKTVIKDERILARLSLIQISGATATVPLSAPSDHLQDISILNISINITSLYNIDISISN